MSNNLFPKLRRVEPRGTDRILLTYSDGVAGEVSVAHLISGGGVFEVLRDESVFREVRVGSCGQVAWNDELELCADALYLELTGKSLDDMLNGQQNISASA